MNTVKGVKGNKPRVSKRNGDRSEADEQYLIGRNRQIFAKAAMAELELRARTGQWISCKDVENGLAFVMVALRSKILMIHRTWAHRLTGLDDPSKTQQVLTDLEYELLDQLCDLQHLTNPKQFFEAAEGSGDKARDQDEMPKRETGVKAKRKGK